MHYIQYNIYNIQHNINTGIYKSGIIQHADWTTERLPLGGEWTGGGVGVCKESSAVC